MLNSIHLKNPKVPKRRSWPRKNSHFKGGYPNFYAPRVGSPRWIILPYIMPGLYPRWRWYQVKGFVCKIPAQSGKTISGYRYLRYPWQIHHGIYWQIGFKYQLPCCNSDGFFFLQYQQSPPYFLLCAIVWWPDWYPLDCTFQSTKKLNHDIWGLLYKSKLTGHCGFVLTNPHDVPIVDCGPESNLLS